MRSRQNIYRVSRRVLALLLLMLAGGALWGQAQEPPTITWATLNSPPGYILEGPEANTGVCDQTRNFMMEQLTGYTHIVKVFPNYARIGQEMIEGKRVCTSCWQYQPPGNAWRQKMSYSMPCMLYFLSHLIVRREDRQLYGENVSLEEVLQHQDRVLGIGAGYGYHPAIYDILSRYGGIEDILALDARQQLIMLRSIPNLYVHTGSEGLESLVKMLVAHRLDALLMNPGSPMYFARQLGIADQIDFVPIAETQDEIGVGAYACPNTEWGRQVIAEINRILEVQRDTPAYKDWIGVDSNIMGQDKRYWSFWDEKVLLVHE